LSMNGRWRWMRSRARNGWPSARAITTLRTS
jgi:hypothetical protein